MLLSECADIGAYAWHVHFCRVFYIPCRMVKLSSPYLNTIIIVGVILLYIDVILFGVDESIADEHIVDINCQVRRNKLV